MRLSVTIFVEIFDYVHVCSYQY